MGSETAVWSTFFGASKAPRDPRLSSFGFLDTIFGVVGGVSKSSSLLEINVRGYMKKNGRLSTQKQYLDSFGARRKLLLS